MANNHSQAPEARVPGREYDGDPGDKEQDVIDQRIHSRLTSRSVRGPQNDPTNMPGQDGHGGTDGPDGVAVGLAVGWGGVNRRGYGATDNYRRRRGGDVVRYHRSIDPRNGVVGSDGLLYITLATCAVDKLWEMRSVILLYQDPWTAGPTGSQAAIFVGQIGTGPKLADLILMGIAIPASVTWSHDQQVVTGGQTIYVAINDPGASPGLYSAQADVCEYNWMEYRMRGL